MSGSFSEQGRLREEADKLWKLGHAVTGTWLHEVKKPAVLTEEEWNRCLAVKDLAELAAADCIVLDVDGTSTTGGRYVEWGYALCQHNMLKVVVGKNRYGVFNTLADAEFDQWDADLFTWLTERSLAAS